MRRERIKNLQDNNREDIFIADRNPYITILQASKRNLRTLQGPCLSTSYSLSNPSSSPLLSTKCVTKPINPSKIISNKENKIIRERERITERVAGRRDDLLIDPRKAGV